MRSKRSCFDKTVFKKNLTRFAPVWVLYTLLLVGMIAMTYSENEINRAYFFVTDFNNSIPEMLAVVNLLYALLVAALLFGDLFNSRMCNALHALPLRREGWMVTNLVSGLFFSFVPTVVMALVSLPLLMGTIFVGAWKIAFQMLLLANLEFICFFGLAVFAAMCTGNWFTMAAGYGLLNAGACIAYWIIDMVYTPMLYGVITPTRLMSLLTPANHMIQKLYKFTDYDELYNIMETTKAPLESLTATYTLRADAWWNIAACAAVGVVFMALALLLYRKRNLECAGDAVAFRGLVPVFQVLCSLFVMVGLLYFLRSYFRYEIQNISPFVILAIGLVLGWIIGKMLVERSTRIFRLKNFYGLAALAAVLAVSLGCTHFDILGIETKLPDPSKVKAIFFETNRIPGTGIAGEEAINDIIRIQELALKNDPNTNKKYKHWRYGDGLYVKGYDGSFVEVVDTNDSLYDHSLENPEFTYVAQIGITYFMKDDSVIKRRYRIWTESEEGELTKKYISSWEFLNGNSVWSEEEGHVYEPVIDEVLDTFTYMTVDNYARGSSREKIKDVEEARSFIEAVRADCAAGTLAQDMYFHKDIFMDPEPIEYEDELYYDKAESVQVSIRGENSSWYVNVYPDSENCVRWLQERGLMNYEIVPNTTQEWIVIK